MAQVLAVGAVSSRVGLAAAGIEAAAGFCLEWFVSSSVGPVSSCLLSLPVVAVCPRAESYPNVKVDFSA